MAISETYWLDLASDYVKAYEKLFNTKPTKHALLLAMGVAEFETQNGRAWPGSYNFGAVQLRTLTDAEMAKFKAGELKAGDMFSGNPGGVLHVDTHPTPNGPEPYPVWFAAFPTQLDGVLYFLRVLLRPNAKTVVDDEASGPVDLARAMYLACYFEGSVPGARGCGKRSLPLTTPEERNVARYASAVTNTMHAVEAHLTKWDVDPVPTPPRPPEPVPNEHWFQFLPGETVNERVVRACDEALEPGPMGHTVRAAWYAIFINCMMHPAGTVGDQAVGSIAGWATSCALFVRATLFWCGRATKIAVNASPMIGGYLQLSFQHASWVPFSAGLTEPDPGDIFYVASNLQAGNGHVGIFLRETAPGEWETAEGGGGADGTLCKKGHRIIRKGFAFDQGRAFLGLFRMRVLAADMPASPIIVSEIITDNAGDDVVDHGADPNTVPAQEPSPTTLSPALAVGLVTALTAAGAALMHYCGVAH